MNSTQLEKELGLEKPFFWQVRLVEIEQTVQSVKKGEVSVIATSPGGHPVYAVAYGNKSDYKGTTNFSGAMAAANAPAYKKEKDEPQVVILVGGCHGGEAEGTAGVMNCIQLLETGEDCAGQKRAELLSLAEKYRIIAIPCFNPDGRHRSPDHLIGKNRQETLFFNQGVWADGSPITYPACKSYQPMDPAKIKRLGGYYNDDGYNLMHDATPGDIRTQEVAGLLKLVAEEKADLVLHLHSCPGGPGLSPAHQGMFDLHRKRMLDYRKRLRELFKAKELITDEHSKEKEDKAAWLDPINLATLTSLVSGALSPLFEQPNGSGKNPIELETSLEMTLGVIELFLSWGLKEPFSPRMELRYSLFDSSQPLNTYLKEKW